jgi:hypothetical protein
MNRDSRGDHGSAAFDPLRCLHPRPRQIRAESRVYPQKPIQDQLRNPVIQYHLTIPGRNYIHHRQRHAEGRQLSQVSYLLDEPYDAPRVKFPTPIPKVDIPSGREVAL